jgi:hypothetical protein
MRLKSFSSLVKYANYAVLILQAGLFCEIIQLQIEECRIQRKGEVVTPWVIFVFVFGCDAKVPPFERTQLSSA